MKEKDVLTTGDVARLCHVTARTVSKWFDTGVLPGYRIPGSRDRRILRAELLRFMRDHNIPLDEPLGHALRILAVTADPADGQAMAAALEHVENYNLTMAANAFQAGAMVEKLVPHVLLVDLTDPRVQGESILACVRANPALTATRVIAVTSGAPGHPANDGLAQGYDMVLLKPYSADDLRRLIEKASDLLT
jgi:excisionase family DNA binding protein